MIESLYQHAVAQGYGGEWTRGTVFWILQCDRRGDPVNLEPSNYTERVRVPAKVVRTSRARANWAVDAIRYIYGKNRILFAEKLRETATQIRDDRIHKLCDKIDAGNLPDLPVGATQHQRCSIRLGDHLLHDIPACREWWESDCASRWDEPGDLTCTLSGRKVSAYGYSPTITGVAGGRSTGVPVITGSKDSALSYSSSNKPPPVGSRALSIVSTYLQHLVWYRYCKLDDNKMAVFASDNDRDSAAVSLALRGEQSVAGTGVVDCILIRAYGSTMSGQVALTMQADALVANIRRAIAMRNLQRFKPFGEPVQSLLSVLRGEPPKYELPAFRLPDGYKYIRSTFSGGQEIHIVRSPAGRVLCTTNGRSFRGYCDQ